MWLGNCFFVKLSELLREVHAALFDTSLLTGEVTEVIEFGAANLTILVDGDGIDEG